MPKGLKQSEPKISMPETLSEAEENYLKGIYHLQLENEEVLAGMLAGKVNTAAASVTDMLRKLGNKGLINYRPYKGFTLTETGKKCALNIVRKHRLWEFFLTEKLGFGWDEVHEIAEELEHIRSNELVSRLDDFLGNPAFDPHGDPIPDSRGRFQKVREVNLSKAPLNQKLVITSIKDQSREMLELLNHFKIEIGSKAEVLHRFEFDGTVELLIGKNNYITISNKVAANINCGL